MHIAAIKNNVVENIVPFDSLNYETTVSYLESLGYQCVSTDTAGIGWTYDGTNFTMPVFSEPEEKQLPNHITKLAFRNRFTAAEKINIELAALDNPTATAQQRQNAALIRVYLKDVDAATFIDLDRQDTKDGVQNLETVGLLAAGRANQILTAEIQSTERYRG